jgi:hypothetical protein
MAKPGKATAASSPAEYRRTQAGVLDVAIIKALSSQGVSEPL